MKVWNLIKGCAILGFAYAVLREAESFGPLWVVCFLGFGYFIGALTERE